jgi:hypothetical protein
MARVTRGKLTYTTTYRWLLASGEHGKLTCRDQAFESDGLFAMMGTRFTGWALEGWVVGLCGMGKVCCVDGLRTWKVGVSVVTLWCANGHWYKIAHSDIGHIARSLAANGMT